MEVCVGDVNIGDGDDDSVERWDSRPYQTRKLICHAIVSAFEHEFLLV